MDKGRGDIDVHPDVWLPNQQSFTDKYVVENGTVNLSEGSYEGVSGFCMPTYMKTEHGISSIYDLATPEAQKLFDLNNDGKGKSGSVHRAGAQPKSIRSKYGITALRTFSSRPPKMKRCSTPKFLLPSRNVRAWCSTATTLTTFTNSTT
nr:glycine betaine ABC transporter substrate-binding protein [Aliamphritea spongicola]